ncbi:MAG TPA: YciI family protein [Burkholderiaceae bacterium]|jgi:uncharacterized protein YciI|nr:YciI family protein [Burkholderiaceae bacterium]
MYWAIYCIDAPQAAELRSAALAAHSAYIRNSKMHIALAGPLVGADGSSAIGSLIIATADNRVEVEAFVKNDPFQTEKVWGQVFIEQFIVPPKQQAPAPLLQEATA